MICAQTIGPFRLTRPLVRFTLRRATLITAREQLSFDNLGTMRLRGPEIQRTNDVAFLLEPASPRRIDAILAAEGIAAPNGRCLGVALSSLPGLRRGPSKSRLVTLFADVVDDFIDATGAAVIFLAHVTGPGAARDDRAMLRALKSAMRHQGNVSLLGGDYRPEEMKGVIGRCTAFMGVRMHANIAALGMNVPTLAIGYSRKSAGIMTAAGQRRWVQDIHDTNCEALSAALGSLWSNRNAVRDDLISRQADIQEHAEKNFTLAEGLLAQLSPQTVLQ